MLIAPKDKAQPIEIKAGFDLAKVLGDGRLAMANVDAVPAGKYGKAALEKLGVWAERVEQGRAGRERARRTAAGLARRGAGRHRLPDRRRRRSQRQDHRHISRRTRTRRIIYPIALTANAAHPDAAAFLAYIKSAKAKPLFEAQGFTVLNPGQS